MEICGSKRLGRHVGRPEISRCCTRGESEEFAKRTDQWEIQDFGDGRGVGLHQPPEEKVKTYYLDKIFAENCMKLKEIGQGARP